MYARLGVPEIWRWRDGRLAVLARRSDGQYVERPTSVTLPGFPLNELSISLSGYPATTEPARAVAAFRRRVRGVGLKA